jgi:hypothetical protein
LADNCLVSVNVIEKYLAREKRMQCFSTPLKDHYGSFRAASLCGMNGATDGKDAFRHALIRLHVMQVSSGDIA